MVFRVLRFLFVHSPAHQTTHAAELALLRVQVLVNRAQQGNMAVPDMQWTLATFVALSLPPALMIILATRRSKRSEHNDDLLLRKQNNMMRACTTSTNTTNTSKSSGSPWPYRRPRATRARRARVFPALWVLVVCGTAAVMSLAGRVAAFLGAGGMMTFRERGGQRHDDHDGASRRCVAGRREPGCVLGGWMPLSRWRKLLRLLLL